MDARHHTASLSPIVAGAWRLAEWQWTAQQRLAWIEGNLDAGVTSFDHANSSVDSSVEALLGEALALRPALRQRMQLVSTCSIGQVVSAQAGHLVQRDNTAAAQLRASVNRSLQALHTDHLDLLLIHQPDAQIDANALAAVVDTLRRAGKVRHFGVSHAAPHQLALLHQRFALATHQVALSPLQQGALHDGTLAQCQALGLRPMAWSPLAGGRIFTGQDEAACRLRATLQAMAEELNVPITTLVIAWVMHHPSQPLPILGSRRIDVAQQALAARALQLDTQQWSRISTAAVGHPVR